VAGGGSSCRRATSALLTLAMTMSSSAVFAGDPGSSFGGPSPQCRALAVPELLTQTTVHRRSISGPEIRRLQERQRRLPCALAQTTVRYCPGLRRLPYAVAQTTVRSSRRARYAEQAEFVSQRGLRQGAYSQNRYLLPIRKQIVSHMLQIVLFVLERKKGPLCSGPPRIHRCRSYAHVSVRSSKGWDLAFLPRQRSRQSCCRPRALSAAKDTRKCAGVIAENDPESFVPAPAPDEAIPIVAPDVMAPSAHLPRAGPGRRFVQGSPGLRSRPAHRETRPDIWRFHPTARV